MKALILKKQSSNEYDQLVTCYTQELGKITAIAKSIFKPTSIQAMHLDILNLVDFELVGNNHVPIITGAQAQNTYSGIKSSVKALSVAFILAEYIEKITFDHFKDDALWNFLIGAFNRLNSNPSDPIHVLRNSQSMLIDVMGYYPNLRECVVCLSASKPGHIAFNLELGGLVCKDCFLQGSNGVLIKEDDVKMFRGISGKLHSSRSLLDVVFEHNAGKKLDSLDFFYQVNSLAGPALTGEAMVK